MDENKHMIEPERFGLWITVGFIIALLSLGVGAVNMKRTYEATAATQMEILFLNQKIEDLKKTVAAKSSSENKSVAIPQPEESEKKTEQ